MKIKTAIIGLALLSMAGVTLAEDRADLDNRIQKMTERFDAFQSQTDKRIPADTLRRAHGIMLVDGTKAGFLFAYQGGGGVAMVRDAKTDKWGPVALVDASQASLGFQIGAEQHFAVVLFMTPESTRMLTGQKFRVGAEARGTAGDQSGGVEAALPPPSVLVYNDRVGLFGGADIKGGSIMPANDSNRLYYGRDVSIGDILFGHEVEPTQAAIHLAERIHSYAKIDQATASK